MKIIFIFGVIFGLALPVQAESGSKPVNDALTLRGQGTANYLLFEVYEARLYLPPGIAAAAALQGETSRRLSLRYKLAIKRSDIELAAWSTLQKQWPDEVLKSRKNQLDQLHAAMRDVNEGDVYTLDYRPTRGVTLSLNDQAVWQGGDARLAEMYFGIWLGEACLSPELRLALLGNKAD
jgi:hypothetical protein